MSGARAFSLLGIGDLTVNNPGNIEKSTSVTNRWQGEYDCSRTRFACFESMAHGYRAMFVLLRNYIKDYKANTIEKMLNRWAPPHENDTNAYIAYVEKQSGIARHYTISENDIDTLERIVYAMSEMENGLPEVNRYGASLLKNAMREGKELARSRFGDYVKVGLGVTGTVLVIGGIYWILKNS